MQITMRALMTLVETIVDGNDLPEGFQPEEGSGLVAFAQDSGSGVIEANFSARSCAIYEFQSYYKGGGRRTLQWLHRFFDDISVIDPGEEDTDARLFWEIMRKEDLVDRLLNDDFEEL